MRFCPAATRTCCQLTTNSLLVRPVLVSAAKGADHDSVHLATHQLCGLWPNPRSTQPPGRSERQEHEPDAHEESDGPCHARV